MEINTSLNILIVDDDPFSVTMLEQQLRNLGCDNISAFSNGPDCLKNITPETNIILLDYNMESMNGMEVMKKARLLNRDAYMVFISGQEDMQTAINALTGGAFDYIIKDSSCGSRLKEVLLKISETVKNHEVYRKGIVF